MLSAAATGRNLLAGVSAVLLARQLRNNGARDRCAGHTVVRTKFQKPFDTIMCIMCLL